MEDVCGKYYRLRRIYYNLFIFLVEKTIGCIIKRNITEDCIFIS